MSIPMIKSFKTYLGIQKEEAGDLEAILQNVVEQYGLEILVSPKEGPLKKALQQAGATPMEISQLLVMTHVKGYEELIRAEDHVQQRDIDRFVANALNETGFTKATVLEYTAAIAYAAGIATDIVDSIPQEDAPAVPEKAFVVPMRVYKAELAQFEQRGPNTGKPLKDLSEEQVRTLQSSAFAGLPRAKRYLGEYLLTNDDRAHTGEAGLKMLKEAARDGDLEAAGLVGDYYYGRMTARDWAKAQRYYVNTGAAALTESRRAAVTDIMNQAAFSNKVLQRSILLSLLACVLLALAPGHSLFPYATWLSVLGVLSMGGAIIVAYFHHRVRPGDSVVWLPITILGIFLSVIALNVLW